MPTPIQRAPDPRLLELLEQVERRSDADEPIGELHTNGAFLHLVRDAVTGTYLVPAYSTLALQVERAHDRLAKVRELGIDPMGGGRLIQFMPYPELPWATSRSHVVAVIDSGILEDHPLLAGRIADVVDVTGEGIEDRSGHGTIQAIRQVLHEPRSQLLIVKAFGGDSQQPSLKTLARALTYLSGLPELGFVFLAGGIDRTKFPQAAVLCAMADALVEAQDLSGSFIATKGNIGNEGSWCPAEASGVTGITVAETRTYRQAMGALGGIGVLQTGPYASFPDIEPLLLEEFRVRYAERFLDDGYLELAEEYARAAVASERTRVQAARILAHVAVRQGDEEGAVRTLEQAASWAPESAEVAGDLARSLARLGSGQAAAGAFRKALRLGSADPKVAHDYGALLERSGHASQALESYLQACDLDEELIWLVDAYGSRRFYDGHYAETEQVLRLLRSRDPTRATALYNISISRFLGGDRVGAEHALSEYETGCAEQLDTSLIHPDPAIVRELFAADDPSAQLAGLAYEVEAPNRHPVQYGTAARFLSSFATGDHERSALPDLGIDDLARSLEATAYRLLLEPSSVWHERLAAALAWVQDRIREPSMRAELLHVRGRLMHRLRRWQDAESDFLAAEPLWESVSVRRREDTCVEAAMSAIAMDRWDLATEALSRGSSTSTEIGEGPGGSPVSTFMTPRLHLVKGWLALRDKQADQAGISAELLLYKDANSLEGRLLLAATLTRAGRIEDARSQILDVFRTVRANPVLRRVFLRLLEDHAIYDREPMPGISLTEAFREADDSWSGADVELARATRVIGRARGVQDGMPDPGLVSAGLLVVLGSGVDAGHPAIKERLVDSIDLTGEGAHDHNGGTTRYLLGFLHEAGTSTELKVVSVKVVDSRGCGSVRQFVQGLATASRLGASVVLAPLQVDIVDWHLLGTVRRIHGACPVLAIPVERGRGACYPSMASEFVVYWRAGG